MPGSALASVPPETRYGTTPSLDRRRPWRRGWCRTAANPDRPRCRSNPRRPARPRHRRPAVPHLRHERRRVLAGQHAPINIADDFAGDDVDAVSAVDDRRHGGVARRGAQAAASRRAQRQLSSLSQLGLAMICSTSVGGVTAERVAHRAQHALDGGGHDRRERCWLSVHQRAAHPQHGRVIARHRGVTRRGARDQAHARAALLTRLAQVKALALDLDRLPPPSLIANSASISSRWLCHIHPAPKSPPASSSAKVAMIRSRSSVSPAA